MHNQEKRKIRTITDGFALMNIFLFVFIYVLVLTNTTATVWERDVYLWKPSR